MNNECENELALKNIETFSKCYGVSVEELKNIEDNLKEDIEVDVEYAYSGKPILTVRKDEVGKRYLAGKYAPEQAFFGWVQKQNRIYNESVFVVVGMGNIHQIEEFLDKIEEKVYLIIYEPSKAIFLKAMKTYDMSEILQKKTVTFIIEGINSEEIKNVFSLIINRGNMALTKIFFSGNYVELFPQPIQCFAQKLKEYLDLSLTDWNTRIRYTDVVGENMFNNIAYYYHGYSVSQFRDFLKPEDPVIIVSAGPSLNKNIDDLKLAVGRCCIIATDTAVKPLLSKGIQPHFIAVVDGKKPASLLECQGVSKSILLTSTVVAKDVMNLHKGKKVFYRAGNYYEEGVIKVINEKRDTQKFEIPVLPSGGSVANTAFSFALYMGAKNIILIGQDLAMTGNKTHADGTFKDKMDTIDTSSKKYFEVESIDGDRILTRQDFDWYRKWFEDIIKNLKKKDKDIKVIDATEGGAKIHGAEILSLREAIASYCKHEVLVDEKILTISEMLSESDKKILLDYFYDTPNKLDNVLNKVKLGLKYYERMLKLVKKQKLNTTKYLDIYKKIKKINDFMNTDEMALFVISNMEAMEHNMISTMNFTEENEREERIVIAQRGITILNNMVDIIKDLSIMVKDLLVEYKGNDNILHERLYNN